MIRLPRLACSGSRSWFQEQYHQTTTHDWMTERVGTIHGYVTYEWSPFTAFSLFFATAFSLLFAT